MSLNYAKIFEHPFKREMLGEKRMVKNIIIVLGIIFILSIGFTLAQTPDKKTAAVSAATSWLKEVDNEQYAKSWAEAAPFFKNAIPEKQWEQSLNAVRKPLGKVISRKLINATYKTALPGAPDGEYVVIQFQTSFANKKSAVETITPMLDKANVWRVSGYYIK